MKLPWQSGVRETAAGSIPMVTGDLTWKDRIDSWMARWGIRRMHFTVPPGLYAIGNPAPESHVFVTANFKMSFDRIRNALKETDGWILVLDTRGINVWCAAGKGTFGTEELIRRIDTVQLGQVVSHKTIILPQLGAPGVAAHIVQRMTGFKPVYGPVKASDIPRFLINHLKAEPSMRRIDFTLPERLVLIPMELLPAMRLVPFFILLAVIDNLIHGRGLTWAILFKTLPFMGALITGSVIFQILLPWLPFRSFVLNGWLLGSVYSLCLAGIYHDSWTGIAAYMLLLPLISAFLAFQFTGSTPFTSLSGVQKELAAALPFFLIALTGGIALYML